MKVYFLSECTEDNQCTYDADKPVCDIILNECIVGKCNYDTFVLFSLILFIEYVFDCKTTKTLILHL